LIIAKNASEFFYGIPMSGKVFQVGANKIAFSHNESEYMKSLLFALTKAEF